MAKTNAAEAPATTEVPATPSTGFVPVIKKRVTVPQLKLVPDVPVYVKFTGKIYEEEKSEKQLPADSESKTISLARVINLQTGEEQAIVVAAVIKGELMKNYPEDSYVGKGFAIEKGKKKDMGGGRGYFVYSIAELDLPE